MDGIGRRDKRERAIGGFYLKRLTNFEHLPAETSLWKGGEEQKNL